jgi:hypothetical protein
MSMPLSLRLTLLVDKRSYCEEINKAGRFVDTVAGVDRSISCRIVKGESSLNMVEVYPGACSVPSNPARTQKNCGVAVWARLNRGSSCELTLLWQNSVDMIRAL